MSCHECVMNSATSLVQIADNLNGQMARQLFTAMYPESACLSMAGAFVQIVAQHTTRRRKPVRIETFHVEPAYQAPLYHVAVA